MKSANTNQEPSMGQASKLPNTAITALKHWAPSFLSGLILHPATKNALCKTFHNSMHFTSCSVSDVLYPFASITKCHLSIQFRHSTSFTKLSIWVRGPQSLLYLLLIILSTLHYEYLSFIQLLSHQLESTLWQEQGLVAFHFLNPVLGRVIWYKLGI